MGLCGPVAVNVLSMYDSNFARSSGFCLLALLDLETRSVTSALANLINKGGNDKVKTEKMAVVPNLQIIHFINVFFIFSYYISNYVLYPKFDGLYGLQTFYFHINKVS